MVRLRDGVTMETVSRNLQHTLRVYADQLLVHGYLHVGATVNDDRHC